VYYSSDAAANESQLAQMIAQNFHDSGATPQSGALFAFGKRTKDRWPLSILVRLYGAAGMDAGIFVVNLDLLHMIKDYTQIDAGYRVEIGPSTASPLPAFDDTGTHPLTMPGMHQKLLGYPLEVTVTPDPSLSLLKLEPSQSNYFRYAMVITVALVVITISFQRKKLYEHLGCSEQDKNSLIEQLEQEKARAFHLASHDYLTGIPNRMLFVELALATLGRARRDDSLYALLFMDLNGFKQINDTLGHATGDLLLKAVAQRLRSSLREYDLVARLGGDEFVVLLSDIQYQSQVAEIADKLLKLIGSPYLHLGGHDLVTSLSIGIALFPSDGENIDELLSKADSAMYEAKRAGCGGYRFYQADSALALPQRQGRSIFLPV